MILKYFTGNRISLLVVIPLALFVLWLPGGFSTVLQPIEPRLSVPLAGYLQQFGLSYPGWSLVISLIVVLLNAYLLVQLNTLHMFIPVRSQLPAFFYLAGVFSSTQWQTLHPGLLASSVLLVMLFRVLGTYKMEGTLLNFLDAGLLVSLASLIYLPAAAIVPVLFIAMVIFRPFNWREYVFSAIGLMIPYLFIFSGYYLAGHSAGEYFSMTGNRIQGGTGIFTLDEVLIFGFYLAMIVFASYFMARSIGNMKIHSRKILLLLLFIFISSLLQWIVFPATGSGMLFFMAIPVTYLFAFYFVTGKANWMNEILFGLFFVAVTVRWVIAFSHTT